MFADVGSRKVGPCCKLIVVDSINEGAGDRAEGGRMKERKMVSKAGVRLLVRKNIELWCSCGTNWHCPQSVGLSGALKDVLGGLGYLNFVTVKRNLTAGITKGGNGEERVGCEFWEDVCLLGLFWEQWAEREHGCMCRLDGRAIGEEQ